MFFIAAKTSAGRLQNILHDLLYDDNHQVRSIRTIQTSNNPLNRNETYQHGRLWAPVNQVLSSSLDLSTTSHKAVETHCFITSWWFSGWCDLIHSSKKLWAESWAAHRYPYWHAKPKTEKLYRSSKFTVFEFSVFSCEKHIEEAGPIFSVVSLHKKAKEIAERQLLSSSFVLPSHQFGLR